MPQNPVRKTPQDRYEEANIRRFVLKANKATMPDLVAHLESQPNVQRYLIALVEADMQKEADA